MYIIGTKVCFEIESQVFHENSPNLAQEFRGIKKEMAKITQFFVYLEVLGF